MLRRLSRLQLVYPGVSLILVLLLLSHPVRSIGEFYSDDSSVAEILVTILQIVIQALPTVPIVSRIKLSLDRNTDNITEKVFVPRED